MDFIPYKINEYLENVFYQVPKELFTNPYYKDLKPYSILLYSLLLDRLSLSMKNEWIDENGDIFLIFTRKEAEEKLNLSDKTVTKAFKELAECNLIYEKKQGRNKPNLIYPCQMVSVEWNRKNYDSGTGKITTLDSENLRRNYTNNNYPNGVNARKNYINFEQRDYKGFDFNTLLANYKEII